LSTRCLACCFCKRREVLRGEERKGRPSVCEAEDRNNSSALALDVDVDVDESGSRSRSR
jgi:hypothetical protein